MKASLSLAPTLLDRLSEPAPTASDSDERLRRDLEILLNETSCAGGWLRELAALADSLLNFGAPDLHALDLSSARQRDAAIAAIEAAIVRWEPRLRRVRVRATPTDDRDDRRLGIAIDAHMSGVGLRFEGAVDPLSHLIRLRGAAHER